MGTVVKMGTVRGRDDSEDTAITFSNEFEKIQCSSNGLYFKVGNSCESHDVGKA